MTLDAHVPDSLLDSGETSLYDVVTSRGGPQGRLPLTADMLRERPSGDLFGMTQDAGMGWDPSRLADAQYVILSTLGGFAPRTVLRSPSVTTRATMNLGWRLPRRPPNSRKGAVPYAAHCTDPCDGRTQGTAGMFDSLAYRNDAAAVFRRQARSVPTARGILGVATCDKGLPAMMMALASFLDRPCVLIPGGVTLPTTDGEDTGKVQSIGARFARGELSLEDAATRRAAPVHRRAEVATSLGPRQVPRWLVRRWG